MWYHNCKSYHAVYNAYLVKIHNLRKIVCNDIIRLVCERGYDNMQNEVEKMDMNAMAHLILKAVALAMGIGVAVLSVLNQIDIRSEFGMLGIGLACLAMDSIIKKEYQ